MPTETNEIGTIYIADENGEYREFGGIKEINVVPDDSIDDLEMDFSYGPITIPIKLTRKDKRYWLTKVFSVPKYQVTEMMFPRKKKRGTMRRKRRGEIK